MDHKMKTKLFLVFAVIGILCSTSASGQISSGTITVVAPNPGSAGDPNLWPQYNPQLAYSPANNTFLVVWEQGANVGTETVSHLYGALVQIQGNGTLSIPSATAGFSLTSSTNAQMKPKVRYGPNNTFLVVWQEFVNGYFQITGTRVTASGTVLDTNGFAVSPAGSYNRVDPDLCWDYVNQRFFVVWADFSYNSGSTYGIYGALVSGNTAIQIPGALSSEGSNYWTFSPIVGFNGTDIAVAWTAKQSVPDSTVNGNSYTRVYTYTPDGASPTPIYNSNTSPIPGSFSGTNGRVLINSENDFLFLVKQVYPCRTLITAFGGFYQLLASGASLQNYSTASQTALPTQFDPYSQTYHYDAAMVSGEVFAVWEGATAMPACSGPWATSARTIYSARITAGIGGAQTVNATDYSSPPVIGDTSGGHNYSPSLAAGGPSGYVVMAFEHDDGKSTSAPTANSHVIEVEAISVD